VLSTAAAAATAAAAHTSPIPCTSRGRRWPPRVGPHREPPSRPWRLRQLLLLLLLLLLLRRLLLLLLAAVLSTSTHDAADVANGP
jgi:hypothetical protein